MRPIRLPLSASLLVLALCGCGPEATTARAEVPSPPSDIAAPPLVALQVPPAEWRAGTTGDEARLALLVAADRYLEPSWTIGSATNNLVAVRQALQSSCGITGQGVVELAGPQVNRDAVKAGLADLGRQIKGRKGVLVVYWTGHGFVDGRGEARWFTHYTRELAAGGYDNVIGRAELAGWIVEACGSGISPVIVADVCRPRINAPPPPATLEPLSLWDLEATRAGRYAEAPPPDRASPFTRAFADSLASLAQSGGGGLEAVFAETRRRCSEATGGRQEPELIRPATAMSDPGLVRSQRIAVAVEAVDACGGRLITGLSVQMDARPATDAAHQLEAVAGRHTVRLSAPGYCARIEEVELTPERGGSTLRVALLPSLVRISGTIEPAGVYGVRLRGLDQAVREGFHRVQATSGSDGRFELRLPAVAAGIEVLVTRGEAIIGRSAVPATLDRYRLVSEAGIEGIRVADLGALRLTVGGGDDAVAKAASGLAQVGAIPLPAALADLPRSTPQELTTAVERNRWDQALRLVDSKRWSLALDQFQQIAVQLPEDLRVRWTAYLVTEQARAADLPTAQAMIDNAPAGLCRQAVVAVVVSRILDGNPTPDVLQRIVALEEQLEPSAQSAARARRLALAATHIQLDADPAGLLAWLRTRTGPAWSEPAWQAARKQGATQALAILTNQALESGLASDDWAPADRLGSLDAAFPDIVADASIAAGRKRMEEERQPAAARLAFAQAQDAFANGDATSAYNRYCDAVKAGANAHYRAQIEPQVEYLRQQLFIRHFNTGLEHEAEGRLVQALASYSAARTYDPEVRHDIARLRKSGVDDAAYRANWALADDAEDSIDRERVAKWAKTRETDTSQAYESFLMEYPRALEAGQARKLRLVAIDRESTARAAATTPAWAREMGKDACGTWATLWVGRHKQTMRLIPAGTFQMGGNTGFKEPAVSHQVSLSPFWLGDSEVTQGLWQAVMNANPSTFTGDEALPVEQVSWEDCQLFLQRLYGHTSLAAALPSEAQWEYASRGGTAGDWVGDLDALAWYTGNSEQRTHPVKSKRANVFGLYDMHGNVEEWVQDRYDQFSPAPVRDPTGPDQGGHRIYRGGSWGLHSIFYTYAYRRIGSETERSAEFGLRLAIPVAP